MTKLFPDQKEGQMQTRRVYPNAAGQQPVRSSVEGTDPKPTPTSRPTRHPGNSVKHV